METAPAPNDTIGPRPRAPIALPYVLGVLSAATVFFLARPSDEITRATRTLHISFLGEPVSIDAGTATRLRASLRAHLRGKVTLELGGIKKTLSREALGARVDELRLSALVRDLSDPTSPILQNAARAPSVPLLLPIPVTLDAKAAIAAVGSLKDDLDEPAQDAKVDLDRRKVVPEIPGRRVKVYETLAAVDEALRAGKETVSIAYDPVAPRVAAAALKDVDLSETLGFFETRYATDHKHTDRTFNLRIAASRLNGKVILPGETFDFNAVVGPRDEAHGYRIAKVIADGELVDGIGGGTCQIAGTLHGAAFFAGLEVVQRTPHTRPSGYIKMGLDAAVAYPHVTLKLRNPFPHPVVLRESVAFGVVRAEVLGPKRARIVTFIRKIDEIIPFSERVVMDDRLPKGVKVITQRGIPGFKVRRYRVVRDGTLAVREKTVDTYPPTQQIVRVGTGLDVGGGKPQPDDHPEYVADEYLVITQGASADSSGKDGGMEEVRVAGKTGTKGWTRKYTTGSVTDVPDGDDEDEAKPSKKVASRKAKP
ncbi:MAG: VanW family protein [Deltaproteobacteria bacterium]|nr:VanW family protein [Deltaproteobacteria bacterium]